MIECGAGVVIDSVPDKYELYDKVCILYRDESTYRADKTNAANKDVFKMLVDVLDDCILRQDFNLDLRIENSG